MTTQKKIIFFICILCSPVEISKHTKPFKGLRFKGPNHSKVSKIFYFFCEQIILFIKDALKC